MNAALFAIIRLLGLSGLGYAIFKSPVMSGKPKRIFRFIVIDTLIPIYFAFNFSRGWRALISYGWWVVALIMIGGGLFVYINTCIGSLIGCRVIQAHPDDPLMQADTVEERKKAYAVLWGTQNATFLPLPLMEGFAPPILLTAMYLWAIGFNIYFWAVIPAKIHAIQEVNTTGAPRSKFHISGPIIGLCVGFVISIFGLDSYYPVPFAACMSAYSKYILWLTLVLLGAVFAGIPYRIKLFPEFGYFLLRFVALPALVGIVLLCLPLGIGEIEAALKLSIVIQFAAPTSTNLMVVFYQYAKKKEVLHYAASATLLSYAIFFASIPVFYIVFHSLYGV